MHKIRSGSRIGVIIGLITIAVVGGAVLWLYDRDPLPVPVSEPVFDGNSRELKATKVVLTLDTPIQKEMNAIWCASFLAAWKTLETDLVKEPLSLQGSPEVALALNNAADPRPHIPKASLYVAAGWYQKGITEQIKKELAQKFPTKAPPTFSEMSPDSILAYAYLEANVKFALPYFQNRRPLVFTDRTGKKTELSSFGTRIGDAHARVELRRQPAILFESWDDEHKLTECVVDLDRTSQPNQIILAFMEPRPTLAEMLAAVEDRIDKAAGMKEGHDDLGPIDMLLVPDMVWRITHQFAELEGQEFANEDLKGQRLEIAQQDIQFRLDRNGARLRSETRVVIAAIPRDYLFNRPFLLYMKKRGAEMPYFVIWIENAELLNKWQSNS